MSNKNHNLLIGEVLQNAGLVNQEQIQKALDFQKKFKKMKLGEILVIQDKVKSKTIDFFVHKWSAIKQRGYQFPIGYYLQQASLLDNQQIQAILTEQKESQLKFGDIAIEKGWLSKNTVRFFLDNLSANSSQLLSLDQLEQYSQDQLHLEHKYVNSSLILTRILAWTGGSPSLSRDICQFFVDSDLNIPTGKEYRAVDQLIENVLINNWFTSKLGNSIRSIKSSLDNNQKHSSLKLWQEYRKVLLSENRPYQRTKEQDELLKIGLVVQEDNKLRVTNLIFSQIFNQDLVVGQINQKQEELDFSNKLAPLQEYSSDTDLKTESNIGLRDLQSMTKIKNDNKNPKESNLLTEKKSLMMISGLVLLIPLLLMVNNFFSSTKKTDQFATLQENTPDSLQEFCEGIDISDSSSRLNTLFKLKQKKKALLNSDPNNFSKFPDICEASLNEMTMLAIPDLGKADRTLDAIRFICHIPPNSEYLTEAEVWLDRWYHSPAWGKETKFYLEEAPDCPAGSHLLEESGHKNH